MLLWLPLFGIAQQKFEKTLALDKTKACCVKGTLQDVSWIAGHWTGTAFGGDLEEIWSPPMGESMMCVFKLVEDDKVVFYEICTISEENESLVLRIRHFGAALHGWEEKDKPLEFGLVKVTKDAVYFDGFTFEYISDAKINIYVRIAENGKVEEVPFYYTKK